MKPLAQNTLIQNRYLVVHLIGKGGMGEVYLAVDQRLGSAVALKRTFFAGDDMLGNAFEREARTLARMRHPVLPKVSDHFGEGDEQYLVMEHISGDDLSKRLEAAGKAFPVSWVLFWADQLLDALSYLHTHEPPIIHRDIKPQNLKLTDENHIILLDFGLSKTSTGQTNISQSGSTGSIVGYTPHYAPMEQIRGIGTSPRSDLYSLSATLYQLLTNSVPVDALSRADSMLNGMPDPIKPPHELNPEVPSVVSEVLLRAMEVSQEKRFANAREMQRVLRKAFNELQQATTASTVAFSAEEAKALRSAVLPSSESNRAESVSSDPGAGASITGQDAPAIEPDRGVDLDATMAYTPVDSGSSDVKQADVRTEVFSGGSISIPETPAEGNDPAPPADPFQYASTPAAEERVGDSFITPSEPGGFPADATVPFIAVDAADIPAPAFTAGAATPAEPEFFEPDEAPDQPSEPASEPYSSDVERAPAAAVAHTAAQPAKKSSNKIIAIVGVLAAVFLLAAAVGGGIWAYMKYGGAAADPDPTPEPSPEQTIFMTPTPEPTIETNSNADNGNVNSNSSSLTDTNSNSGLMVDPTPARQPETEPPVSGTRPTPRPGQTPRPQGTPAPRATPARTPAPRATVMP